MNERQAFTACVAIGSLLFSAIGMFTSPYPLFGFWWLGVAGVFAILSNVRVDK